MYRRLLSNTVLFSVSTFGSKILLFLLTPFYTSILTDAEYGVTDLIIQTGNVLIPLVSMGIINAVLRFGLDETTDLKGLFTTGLVVILVGEGVLALCYPLLQSIGLLSDYVLLLLLYVLMANLHAVFGAMAQAMGKVRLYAVSGILCTALVVALNILLPVGVPAGNCGVCPLQRHRRRGGGAGAVCRPGAVAGTSSRRRWGGAW